MSVDELGRKEAYRKEAFAAWLRIARFFKRSERNGAERLKAWNISIPQSEIIGHVGGSSEIIQQDLAGRLLSTQGNISQLLQGLEQRGLVKREKQGRTNRVSLKEKGKILHEEVTPAMTAWHASQFDALSDAELKELLRLLRKIDRQTN